MRQVLHPQLQLGETDIGAIFLDPKSRDDIPHLLRGLQHIYTTPTLRQAVFAILEEVLPDRIKAEGKADPNTGRPGMEQWKILVLGVVRLGLNADYDRLQELANQHKTLRLMLGHSEYFDNDYYYEAQTLKDNLRLFTPEILDRINQEVVQAGHVLLKKSPEEGLGIRCDSFVVETNVHYPTDVNLLWDAIRKIIPICALFCDEHRLSHWRQSAYNLRSFKKKYRAIQTLKRSRSKDEGKRQDRRDAIQTAHALYLEQAEHFVERAVETRRLLKEEWRMCEAEFEELDTFVMHARRQINQIRRRVLQGETIHHSEKVFSLFQPHTEWISKGKAGVPVELGLRVCVVEDQHRFILHHRVMEKTTDEQIAVAMIKETQARYANVQSASMDKGFYSRPNLTELTKLLPLAVLPKKGRWSQADQERETAPEFIRLRHQHSAVESAINALEAHGLNKCRDHGITGFKRYVALAVLARNIQRLGVVLREKEQEALKQQERRLCPDRKAA